MSQYFLSCLECSDTIEMEEVEEADFRMHGLLAWEELATISLGPFFLLHRGHALVFTTKE